MVADEDRALLDENRLKGTTISPLGKRNDFHGLRSEILSAE